MSSLLRINAALNCNHMLRSWMCVRSTKINNRVTFIPRLRFPAASNSFLRQHCDTQNSRIVARRLGGSNNGVYRSTANTYDQDHGGRNNPLFRLIGFGLFGLSLSIFAIFKMNKNDGKIPFSIAHCVKSDGRSSSQRFNFLAEAVEIASPSVVYVEKSQTVTTIFGEMVGVSSGSGFIVHDGGYVLTNAHVVANSRSVQVKLSTGRVVKGEVTDIDQVSDLALIKLELPGNEKLTAVKFGSSSSLRPGEWVVALGSPLNLTNTITAGIVSSALRPSRELGLEHHKPDMEYVQTDAPITHGNSGGPLVNLDGEVIGVNTMTAGPGISFAIPSDFAQNFVEKAVKTVKKETKATKYALGVSMLSINPRILRVLLQKMSLPRDLTHGVFLANVWGNSAAAQAGLRTGDIIVRINGKNVHSSRDVNELVQRGERLEIVVVRKGKWVTVSAVPEPLYTED